MKFCSEVMNEPDFDIETPFETGPAEGNQRLSQQRAYALEDWLIKNSITTRDKIDTQGAGDLYPIAASSASSSLNRRVEVRIDCSGNKTQ